MNRIAVLFLLPALLLAAPVKKKPRHRKAAVKKSAPRFTGPVNVIEDVSVIDVASGVAVAHQDIVIRGDRIADVRDAAKRVKDVRYVIPGLWDMHVHLWFPKTQFASYLANGVTGVRDMGSDLKRVREWQKQAGVPRIYTSGDPMSDAPSDNKDMPVNVVTTPQDARTMFDRYYDQRVDFIKLLDVSPQVFGALAESSRHGGLPFAGHLPWGVSAFEAAQDRMVSMEHLFGVGLACSRKENELRARGLIAREKSDAVEAEKINAEIIRTYDPVGALALWDTFRRYGVRQTPTLSWWERAGTKAQLDFAFRLTGDMAKNGVGVLAGTDTGDPGTVPGVALHHELELLVKAGLTPAQALRAATVEPARLMRRELDIGQIKPGFTADLVILRANPLEDIANTRSIEKVLLRGVKYDDPKGR